MNGECPRQQVCSKRIWDLTAWPNSTAVRPFRCQLLSEYVSEVGPSSLFGHSVGMPCKVLTLWDQRESFIRQCLPGEYCGARGAPTPGLINNNPHQAMAPIRCVDFVQETKQDPEFSKRCYSNGPFAQKCCGMSFQNQNSPMKRFNDLQCKKHEVCSTSLKEAMVLSHTTDLENMGLHEPVFIFIHKCETKRSFLWDIKSSNGFVRNCYRQKCCGISYRDQVSITKFTERQYTCGPSQQCSPYRKVSVQVFSSDSFTHENVFVHFCVPTWQLYNPYYYNPNYHN